MTEDLKTLNSSTGNQAEPERKPYQKPVLTEYGTLAKLTQGGGGTVGEGGAGTMIPCL